MKRYLCFGVDWQLHLVDFVFFKQAAAAAATNNNNLLILSQLNGPNLHQRRDAIKSKLLRTFSPQQFELVYRVFSGLSPAELLDDSKVENAAKQVRLQLRKSGLGEESITDGAFGMRRLVHLERMLVTS